MREPTALRTPHHKNTRPIPAVTRVASTPTTVLTLICDVIAVITEAQSEAVTTLEGGSDRGISCKTAETAKTSNAVTKNTSLYKLDINRTAKAVVDNIVFVPGKDLINGIGLIVHIGGDFFDIRYTTSTRPSIAGYFFDAMQIVIIIVDALKLADAMLDT
jgi:hypothetical protein